MEKEILFVNLIKGEKNGKNWYRVDYIIVASQKMKSDFIDALQYEKLKKKSENKQLTKCTGVFDVNDYERVILVDIK